jgi:hypothetical protein
MIFRWPQEGTDKPEITLEAIAFSRPFLSGGPVRFDVLIARSRRTSLLLSSEQAVRMSPPGLHRVDKKRTHLVA